MATSQTAVFRRSVRDHMGPPPIRLSAATCAGDLVRRLTERSASAAIVMGSAGELVGIVTEQDVVRRMRGAEQPVVELMSSPVATVRAEEPRYRAIGFMRRHRLRHMPVLDERGALAGMVELHMRWPSPRETWWTISTG